MINLFKDLPAMLLVELTQYRLCGAFFLEQPLVHDVANVARIEVHA